MTKTKKSEAERKAEEAAERQNAINEADATFREEVAKAAEKRAKAVEKAGGPTNIAERAWNETKSDDDPAYNAVAATFREKLDTVVTAIRDSGNADVVGLEEFEARAKELLAEEGVEPGSTGLVPTSGAGRPTETAETDAATDKAKAKKAGK